MVDQLDKILAPYETLFINLKNEQAVELQKIEPEQLMKEVTEDVVKTGMGGKTQLAFLELMHYYTDKLHKVRAIADSRIVRR